MPETRTIVQLHKKDDREKRWIPLSTGKCVELTDYENNGETGNIETTDDLNNALAKLENRKADIGSTLSDYNIEDAYTKDEVDALLASIYRVQGGIESTDVHGKLSNPDTRIGDVYDLKDDMVMTSDFIEYEQGVTKTISAGTNIVVVEDENENLKFDVLALSVSGQDTTYTISFSNGVLTLTPSTGTAQTVNIPDTDTTYALSISGRTISLTPSTGTADTVTVPTELPALSGNTNKYLKVIDNGGTLTVSWETVSTGTTYSAGTGLELSQQNVLSAKLKSTTAATNDSENISNTQGRQYAVVPDKTNGYLSVNVPWEDHQYSNETAAQGGTTESLVTTGDKYNWNSKPDIGTGSTDAAAGNHTHTISLATDSGTPTVNLSANTTYKLTAGGQSVILKTPQDSDTTYNSGTGIDIDANNNVNVKLGYTTSGNNRAVKTDTNGKLYVTQTDTTYSDYTPASSSAGAAGLVPAPSTNDKAKFLNGGSGWVALAVDETKTVSSGAASFAVTYGHNYFVGGADVSAISSGSNNAVNTLTITGVNSTDNPTGADFEANIFFKAGSSFTKPTFSNNTPMLIGELPTFEADGIYLMSLYKGTVIFGTLSSYANA